MKGLVSTMLIIAIVIVLIWWVVRWSTQTSTVILSGPLCVDSLDCPKGYNKNPPIINKTTLYQEMQLHLIIPFHYGIM